MPENRSFVSTLRPNLTAYSNAFAFWMLVSGSFHFLCRVELFRGRRCHKLMLGLFLRPGTCHGDKNPVRLHILLALFLGERAYDAALKRYRGEYCKSTVAGIRRCFERECLIFIAFLIWERQILSRRSLRFANNIETLARRTERVKFLANKQAPFFRNPRWPNGISTRSAATMHPSLSTSVSGKPYCKPFDNPFGEPCYKPICEPFTRPAQAFKRKVALRRSAPPKRSADTS
jgi:hypothetical protein